MENRTEIGNAFREKLDLLDKKPSDRLWASIENDLDKKRKRRILFWLIPFFLGTALLTSALFFMQSDQDKNKPSVDKQKQVVSSQSNDSKNDKTKKNQDQSTKVIPSKTKTITKSAEEQSIETSTIKKSRTEKLIKESKKLIVSTDEYEEYEVTKKYKVVIKKNQTTTTTKKISYPKTAKTTNKTPSKTPSKTSLKTDSKTPEKKKKTVKNKTNITKEIAPQPVTKDLEPVKEKESLGENSNNIPAPINEAVTATKKDSTIQKPKRQLTPKREYIKRDYPQQKNSSDAEYSVSVFYGPAVFGSLAGESMINPSLSDLPKSHPITSHYGFYFKSMYNKLGFRVGISKINLKTITHLNSDKLIPSYNNITLQYYSSEMINNEFKNSGQVDLEQKISYYEMPLEFNYALKKDESKFGAEVFTGFSILILDDNQLFLSSDKIKNKQIGEAKNVSETNLSYNLGLGFNYKLTEKFQLDINPIFKYYLTTFNENNTPKPYSFSIQSGVTYKF